MIWYALSLIITIFFAAVGVKTKKKKFSTICKILSTIPFILMLGLRGRTIGIDTSLNYIPSYSIAYNYRDNMDFFGFFSTKYTFGFSLLLFIVSAFTSAHSIFFLICAAVTIGFAFKCIYKESKQPILSIFIYFCLGYLMLSMNAMRSFMALSIVVYSISYVKERKFMKFLLSVICAASIHSFMVIFIILYPLYKIKFRSYYFIICGSAVAIMLLFGRSILSFILQGTSYINYFKGDKLFIDPLYSMLLINIGLFALFMVLYRKKRKNKEYGLYLYLQMASLMICLLSFVIPQSYRVEQIIDFFHILSVPYIMSEIKYDLKDTKVIKDGILKGKNKNGILVRGLIMAIALTYSAYFTRSFVLHDENKTRDYVTVFRENK